MGFISKVYGGAMLLIKEVWFEAAHKLDITGPCGRLHGHSYKVLFEIDGPIKDNGMVIDYSQLKEITNQFDHHRSLLGTQD